MSRGQKKDYWDGAQRLAMVRDCRAVSEGPREGLIN